MINQSQSNLNRAGSVRVGLTLILSVPPSAWFWLYRYTNGKLAQLAEQVGKTVEYKSQPNPTT